MSWDVCSCTTGTEVILRFSFYDLKFYLCEWDFFQCICLCTMYMQCLNSIEEDFMSSGTEIRDSFDLACGWKELKFGHLYGQPEL